MLKHKKGYTVTLMGLLFLHLTLFLPDLCVAQEDPEAKGLEIMQKLYEQISCRNWRSDVLMRLISRSGDVQTRHLKRLSKTDERDCEHYHLRYTSPPSVRNTTLLIIENKERSDDVWMYFPAIKKTRRLSGTNLQSSYMGTEFSYKDIKREKVDPQHNRYVYIGEEELNGLAHYIIDAYPVSKQEKSEQGYEYRRLWVRKDNYLATRINFYKQEGELLKTLVSSDMRPVGESGKFRYHQMLMTNVKGVKTELIFNMLRLDEEDPDDKYFTLNYLSQR